MRSMWKYATGNVRSNTRLGREGQGMDTQLDAIGNLTIRCYYTVKGDTCAFLKNLSVLYLHHIILLI